MLSRLMLATVLTVTSASHLASQQIRSADAIAIIDRGVERMGGENALRAIQSVRIDMITQWQRFAFIDHPSADQPSYERNVELRDYRANAWRNTRSFLTTPNNTTVIVRDTIASVWNANQAGQVVGAPLSVAYVDERRELFTFAPERVLLLAREASDLRRVADTTIAGDVHARLSATMAGYPATLFLRQRDGLPSMVRFLANEDNDLGLAPWGMMEVEFWYSNWTTVAPGVLLPRQRDVWRVRKPYKRMTALSMAVNAPAPADSFAISDSLTNAYLNTQRRPMWDVPVDGVRIIDDAFVSFPPMMGVANAVRVGGRWVLLETAQSIGAARKVEEWLSRRTPETPIGAAIVTLNFGNGGVARLANTGTSIYVAPAAAPMIEQILRDAPSGGTRPAVISTGRWVRVGTDSLWLEPVDSPNITGALAVYSPTLRWVYAPAIIGSSVTAVEQQALVSRLRARGFIVEWLGSMRALRAPASE